MRTEPAISNRDEAADLRSIRHLLQQTISAFQHLMGEHPPSRRLRQGLALLWAVADSIEELERAGGN